MVIYTKTLVNGTYTSSHLLHSNWHKLTFTLCFISTHAWRSLHKDIYFIVLYVKTDNIQQFTSNYVLFNTCFIYYFALVQIALHQILVWQYFTIRHILSSIQIVHNSYCELVEYYIVKWAMDVQLFQALTPGLTH